ncbi:MAG: peptidylprolyl isomerase [Chloroflexi bacterium]|nr:peptidylprolyl isomerase [Chloroflexota bacterium]
MSVRLRRRRLLALLPASVAALGLSAACSQAGSSPSAPRTANEQQTGAKPSEAKPADAKPTAAAAAASPKLAQKPLAGPPAMSIDQNKQYTALIKTSMGDMTAELYAKDAPNTVNNFVFLSREGFYNGVIFHRIIKEFMVQTGDPQGTGMGGPGYKFNDELTGPQTYVKGTLAMANAGPNTQGSQFFICHGSRAETLPKRYSIFGKVTTGLDVLDKIAGVQVRPGPSGEPSQPVDPPKIDTVQIAEA